MLRQRRRFVLGAVIDQQDFEVAVLLVEQNVVQSLEVANRAYILAEGKFVMSGSAADIGANPQLKRADLGL